MERWIAWMLVAWLPVIAAAQGGTAADSRRQVVETERAFAKTMADRDQRAFSEFISSEAVFFAGAARLRGKDEVIAHWSRFFAGATAPFSWEPADVEVLESGTLALSSGPVRDPSGALIGRFTSIWRLEPPHGWRIVFDQGAPACRCGEAQQRQ